MLWLCNSSNCYPRSFFVWVCWSFASCSVKEQNVWGTSVCLRSIQPPSLVWNMICFSTEPQTAESVDPDKTVFFYGKEVWVKPGQTACCLQPVRRSVTVHHIAELLDTHIVSSCCGGKRDPSTTKPSKSLISCLFLHRDMLLLGLSSRNVCSSGQTLCHHQQLLLSKAKAQLPC